MMERRELQVSPNQTPAEHIAIGNWLLNHAEWPGWAPDRQASFVATAQAHFAAATAKATVLAVFDSAEADVAEAGEKLRQRRLAALEAKDR